MRRLRFLRILLPAALVLFLILVVVTLQPPTQVHREPGSVQPDAGRRAEGLRLMQIVGQTLVLDFDADLVEETEDGKVHLENVARFVIDR